MSQAHETAPETREATPMSDQIFLPAIFQGLVRTLGHLYRQARRLFDRKGFTIEYPEERRPIPNRYRGEPRLKLDEQGRLKCVACYMCQTACPSQCIHIVAQVAPWPDREKYPKIFNLDMLRCIYCGFCEEACPVDAIALSKNYNICSYTRAERVYDKERLSRPD